MNQEQDLMSRMKRLNRVNKEGGSMSVEERTFFEQAKKQTEKLEAQARASVSIIK